MKATYRVPRDRQRAIPEGGQLAAAEARFAEAQAACRPITEELEQLCSKRTGLRAQLKQLNDPRSSAAVADVTGVEAELALVERQLAAVDTDVRDPDSARYAAREEQSFALTSVQCAQ